MHDIEVIAKSLRIARVSSLDVSMRTDHLANLRDLVLSSNKAYPDILGWFEAKVIPGLLSSQRVAYVGYVGEKPAGCTILRYGEDVKICHVQVKESFRNLHLGETLMFLVALESRSAARAVHMTLPQSLWEAKRGFFESFGLSSPHRAWKQYRPSDAELVCSAAFSQFWDAATNKLHKLFPLFRLDQSAPTHLVISIQPKYALRIVEGRKRVEIRRRFARKWSGARLALYASNPVCAIIGEATVDKVVSDTPSSIWATFHSDVGCSEEEFLSYVGTASKVHAIVLKNVEPYNRTLPLKEVGEIINMPLAPPQSYCTVQGQSTWVKAMPVARMLHRAPCVITGK
ncbi:MAG TPA: hypothetical protein VMX94_03080 [Armatimonadota bacterium]|nr:hypothetical protein [Armatimonadota bacterium]